jgi:hypothetical protein
VSIETFGNFSNTNVRVVNSATKLDNVPVDIPSYLNRKTKAKTLKSYIAARDGCFDRGLWQEPLVGELPSGERLLIDGDHRRALWRQAYPNKKFMPAQIVPVSDKEEISRLFVAINKTARTSLSANEVFVHEVLGGNLEAKKTSAHLRQCSLKVGLGTREEGSEVGDVNGPEVSIMGFKKAIKESSASTVQNASKTIQNLWADDRTVGIELLRGLAKVYKHTPILTKHSQAFEDFLRVRQAADTTQKEVATSFKREGGNQLHFAATCIAHGILSKFKKWSVSNKRMSASTFNKYYGSYIKNLEFKLAS